MFNNLEAEIKRNRIKKGDIAVKLNITASTFSQKLNGNAPITVDEAKKIQEIIGGNHTLDYLFESECGA